METTTDRESQPAEVALISESRTAEQCNEGMSVPPTLAAIVKESEEASAEAQKRDLVVPDNPISAVVFAADGRTVHSPVDNADVQMPAENGVLLGAQARISELGCHVGAETLAEPRDLRSAERNTEDAKVDETVEDSRTGVAPSAKQLLSNPCLDPTFAGCAGPETQQSPKFEVPAPASEQEVSGKPVTKVDETVEDSRTGMATNAKELLSNLSLDPTLTGCPGADETRQSPKFEVPAPATEPEVSGNPMADTGIAEPESQQNEDIQLQQNQCQSKPISAEQRTNSTRPQDAVLPLAGQSNRAAMTDATIPSTTPLLSETGPGLANALGGTSRLQAAGGGTEEELTPTTEAHVGEKRDAVTVPTEQEVFATVPSNGKAEAGVEVPDEPNVTERQGPPPAAAPLQLDAPHHSAQIEVNTVSLPEDSEKERKHHQNDSDVKGDDAESGSNSGSDSNSQSNSSDEGSSSSDDESSAEDTAAGALDKEASGNPPSSGLAEAAAALKDMEDEDGAETGPLRTKNEKDADALEIRRPTVEITAAYSLRALGKVSGVMEKAVIVMSAAAEKATTGENRRAAGDREISEASALDAGSIICFEDRTVLGEVFETFGPVTAPLYIIRFNSREEIDAVKATVGREVLSVPELCKTVRAKDVRKKGYDSSNIYDEESHGNLLEFSDDEAEAEARRGRKRGKRDTPRGGAGGGTLKRGRGEHRHGRANRNPQMGWGPRQRGEASGSVAGMPTVAYAGMQQRGGFSNMPSNDNYNSATPNGGYRNVLQNVGYPSVPQNGGFPNAPGNGNFPIALMNGGYPNAAPNRGYSNAPFMPSTPGFPPGAAQWGAPISPPRMLPGTGMMLPESYPGGAPFATPPGGMNAPFATPPGSMSAPFATPGGPPPFGQGQHFRSRPGALPPLNQRWPGAGNGAPPSHFQGPQHQWPGVPPPHNFPPPRQ